MQSPLVLRSVSLASSLALVASTALCIGPLHAFAEPASDGASEVVGLGPLQGTETFPAADQEELRRRTLEGLERAGFDVQESGPADAFVRPRIVQEHGDYVVTVDYEQNGQVLLTIEDTCELCGVQELGETMASLGAQLQRSRAKLSDTSLLRVSSTPAGATVRLDDQYIGTTPLDAEVRPGSYVLTVEQEGYRSEQRDVELAPAAQSTYSLSLRQQGYRKWLPWAALGAGVAATTTGIALLAIHGNEIESDCNPDVDGRCQYLHDTLPGGVTMTVVGAAFLVTGATLAVVWRNKKGSARASIVPQAGGLAVRF